MSFLWQSLCKAEVDTTGNTAGSGQVPPLVFCSLKPTSQALTRAESLWAGHMHGCSLNLHTAQHP